MPGNRAVWGLSQHSAREVLAEALSRLRQLGINEAIVIQSDGGSDFTSELFQNYCSTIGQWLRSKVNQKGGMGILERLNRTFKYSFLFREECRNFAQLRDICRRFECWYNFARKHSSIGFKTPWQALLGEVETTSAHPGPQDQNSCLVHQSSGSNATSSIRDNTCCTAIILPSDFGGSESTKNDPRKTALSDCPLTRVGVDLDIRFAPDQKVC